MLEFCVPQEPTSKNEGQLLAWIDNHETKLMAYLQTTITMLAGILAKYLIQGDFEKHNKKNFEFSKNSQNFENFQK